MEIFKEFTFEAAHRLDTFPRNESYSRIHGHSYTAVVYICGAIDPQTGWFIGNYIRGIALMVQSVPKPIEPAADEIEITPEMIEAGIGTLLRYHREYSDEADVVREIFQRMISARQPCS